jgi:hypothetical protein
MILTTIFVELRVVAERWQIAHRPSLESRAVPWPKAIENVVNFKNERLLWLWWNFNRNPKAQYFIYLITIDAYM